MLQNSIRFLLIIIFISCSFDLSAQSKIYRGPEDEAGDVTARRIGLMNGNRVLLRFGNRIALGGWPDRNVSLWPNDDTGLNTLDAFNLIIGNMVFIKNDSIPVTDDNEIENLTRSRELDTLWYVQSSSLQPGFEDLNPQGTIAWAFEPVFGYFNKSQDYPAMSNQPNSWPPEGWPVEGRNTDWAGYWKGRYGKGQKTAELEAYFVANDAQDQENLQSTVTTKYYPRPDKKIGYLHPENVSAQLASPWGGLGIRVEVRSYQWNNLQARDAVFFEYAISNISDYDLTRTIFGFYLDAANGNKAPLGGTEDQIGYFDKIEDLAYTWSKGGRGYGGGKPCVSGWAFLESPGIPAGGIDEDDDGLVDEKRDNQALIKIGPKDGIANLEKFLSFYNIKEEDLKEHWDADEDQDWKDGNDKDGNGIYDITEDPGDDVGNDGVGPADINYTAPDADGSECNHKPDFDEGLNSGEPNFGLLDVSESDMLGLTSFHMFVHPQANSPQIKYDKDAYSILAEDTLIEFYGTPTNLYTAFGSGTFRLAKGRTERLSMAQINSYEEQSSLNTDANHSAPSLYIKKKVVQAIYETDYRFAKAPIKPTLTAKAGDGKVYLTWDDVADRLTREPFLKNVNDFEGYKIYKATDKYFRDAELLYDAYGNAAGKKAIKQFDLKDGLKGTPPHTVFNGLGYNLGDDTGIQHFYIDTDVQNGRTYYYAVVAYDYGIIDSSAGGINVPPTENDVVIDLNEYEEINFTGINVKVVTPYKTPAGYVEPNIILDDPQKLSEDGEISATIFNSDGVKPNETYKIKFQTTEISHLKSGTARHERDRFITTTGFEIYNGKDSVLYSEDGVASQSDNWVKSKIKTTTATLDYAFPNPDDGMTTDVIDGIQVFIKPYTSDTMRVLNSAKTGWVKGNTPIDVQINPIHSRYFNYDYDIVFSDSLYTTKTSTVSFLAPVWDVNNEKLPTARVLLNQSFPFYVINKSVPQDSLGSYEKLDLLVDDVNANKVFDPDSDYVLVGYQNKVFCGTIFGFRFPSGVIPSPGDVYRLDFYRPLQDSIMFTVNLDNATDISKIKTGMDEIKVVPNPYIITNTMEPAINSAGFNQQRKLLFTRIPAKCKIKIFTSSGVFVQELDIENSQDNGSYHWDMLTQEGLEIAAGVYVYLVESKLTGDKKIGKFAVVK